MPQGKREVKRERTDPLDAVENDEQLTLRLQRGKAPVVSDPFKDWLEVPQAAASRKAPWRRVENRQTAAGVVPKASDPAMAQQPRRVAPGLSSRYRLRDLMNQKVLLRVRLASGAPFSPLSLSFLSSLMPLFLIRPPSSLSRFSGMFCAVYWRGTLSSAVVIKAEPSEPSVTASPEGSNDDVEDFAHSVSAYTRTRIAYTPSGDSPTPGPSNCRGESEAPFFAQQIRFATAPPQASPKQIGASTTRFVSAQPNGEGSGLSKRLKDARRIRDNAQTRLRNATLAYERNPCPKTKEKLAKERQAREEAGMEVDRLRALMG
ncbi:hypothetical protein NMY22_g9510 [Coprinellus aureogranulatus]|nr:hypothetical protein NMY22_g9510 [Coprinellus aureogranulatus]